MMDPRDGLREKSKKKKNNKGGRGEQERQTLDPKPVVILVGSSS